MRTQGWWLRAGTVPLLAAVAIGGVSLMNAEARVSKRAPVQGKLQSTGVDADADGDFQENVEDGLPDGTGEMAGELDIQAKNLARNSTFTVNVAGTQVAKLKTNRLGRGQVRIKGKKLVVDPRGQHLSVTDQNGDEVLGAEVDDPTTPGGVRCCLNTADQQGCTELLPAECAAAGGTDMGAGSCDPDPCPNTGPDDEANDGSNDTETNDGTANAARSGRR